MVADRKWNLACLFDKEAIKAYIDGSVYFYNLLLQEEKAVWNLVSKRKQQ